MLEISGRREEDSICGVWAETGGPAFPPRRKCSVWQQVDRAQCGDPAEWPLGLWLAEHRADRDVKNANRWNACLEPSPRAVAMSGPPFGASLAYADRKRLPGWRAVRIFIGWSQMLSVRRPKRSDYAREASWGHSPAPALRVGPSLRRSCHLWRELLNQNRIVVCQVHVNGSGQAGRRVCLIALFSLPSDPVRK